MKRASATDLDPRTRLARPFGQTQRPAMSRQHAAQGAFPTEKGTTFRVWAPRTKAMSIELDSGRSFPMRRDSAGFFETTLAEARVGTRYAYLFPDGRRRADPASRLQEGSVHGPSTVVDLAYPWTDSAWGAPPLERLVFYEIHPGTFTAEGTLDAIIPRLPALSDLGVTALQLMPVAAFDGRWGWGYDGVLPYAVHGPYGGPRALQRLVDAAHAQGLAVFVDVVYNHLGPSGNYLREFGPYFTNRYSTPWGEAVNYDGADVGPVRDFFIDNALAYVRDFHADGLRLDAVHGIFDDSPRHVLRELNERIQAWASERGRTVHVIAESDHNDPVVVRPETEGGWGLAAQWSDDFHHALHALLTGERDGYYADFGTVEDLAKSLREAFVVTGQRSRYRGRPHGRSAAGIPGRRFVIASQNHDQIGNRALGDRLAASLPPEALRLAAAATLLSPSLPLLFMGEEYAEPAPFQYFTSFPDAELGHAVSEGRRREFEGFAWGGHVPDPQDPATFARSHIDFALADREPHAAMRRFYKAALKLRRDVPALREDRRERIDVECVEGRAIRLRRRSEEDEALLVLNVSAGTTIVPLPPGRWRVALDSWARTFAGEGRWALRHSFRNCDCESVQPERIETESRAPRLRACGATLGVTGDTPSEIGKDAVRQPEDRLELGPWHAALLLREP